MLLSARNIVKTYSTNQKNAKVLKGVDLDISEGEFVSLIGPSGAGKSTLLHIVGALDVPDSGDVDINFDGSVKKFLKLSQNDAAKIRNKYIGFIFQFHHLLPEFSALENIMMPAMIGGDSYSKAKNKALDLLKMVDLDIRESHRPSELSGGEQQRVAIARAMINSPKLIIADEPTGNLDRANSLNILNIIDELRIKTGAAFIIATHSDEVSSASQRIVKMRDGLIELV
jgi:lipoprotein-releasing system ATP-binding protein